MSLSKLVRIGVLGASAWVLMYMAGFKLPIFPAFLKVDPGDAPALLATYTMGIGAGLWTEVIKVVLHLVLRGGNLVGHAGNLVAGATFVLCAGLVYWRRGSQSMLLASIAGAVGVAVVMIPANALVFLPPHGITGVAAWTMAVKVLAPFNLVKFGLSAAIGHAISARILPLVAQLSGRSARAQS